MPTAPAARRQLAWLSILLLVLALVAVTQRATRTLTGLPAPVPASAGHRVLSAHPFAAPPTTADCEASLGVACYSPNQLRKAYGLDDLPRDGAGTTIAIVDAFGSPTVEADLRAFDQAFGLPDPPSVRTITPAGDVPPFNPADPTMAGWALETSLDVQYAHAMAPGADILVVATPIAETEGLSGLAEIVQAENYVLDNDLADVISQSFGATENTFPADTDRTALRSAFVKANANDVTVLAASGDTGATDYQENGTTLYPSPVVSWPSSDPLVTSVGGTQLHLDAEGNRTAPDVVWNDGYGAGGGGLSSWFDRPSFQDDVSSVVGDRRGTPDVSLTAAVDGGALVYIGFDPSMTGFALVGGTSEATPVLAGIVAVADQYAGHRLGNLNGALYDLAGGDAAGSGIVDVQQGDNTFGGVTGYPARSGYDLASGLGTVDAPAFVPALAGGTDPR
jgi:subtilase family serine protease